MDSIESEDAKSVALDSQVASTASAEEPAAAPKPETTEDSSNRPQFPDGGVRGWQQVVMGFLLMFSSWGLINAFGIYQTFYSAPPSLGSPSAISWIGSLQTCILLICGALGGGIMDAGYARIMTIIGSAFIVISIFGASLSGDDSTIATDGKPNLVYWQILLSQGILGGLGMGMVFLPSVGIPATYFVKRRSLAIGCVTSGAPLGGIIFPIMLELLIQEVGFRWATRAVGFLNAATLGIACLLIRPRTDIPKKQKGPLIHVAAFRELRYTVLVLGLSFSLSAVYIPFYFIQSRIEAAKIDLNGLKSFYFVTFLSVGGVFGRLVPNYLADKTEPIFIQSTFVFTGGLLIFAWPFALSVASLTTFAIIFGFFSGAFTSLPPASMASITTDMSLYGARFGMAVTINGLAVLAGPPIAGAIIGQTGSYVGAAVFAGFAAIIGASFLATAFLLSPGSVRKVKDMFVSKLPVWIRLAVGMKSAVAPAAFPLVISLSSDLLFRPLLGIGASLSWMDFYKISPMKAMSTVGHS